MATPRCALLFGILALAAACAPAPDPASNAAVLPRLDLQVRNSGLRGGYLWLSITGGAGRWHRFGQATFSCMTCPVPFGGAGPSYDIAVFDESCRMVAKHQATGGELLVEIDLGPVVRLVEAPPLQDWMPEDSAPADPATVPCATP